MPNWCYNQLIITGDQEQLDNFKATAYREDDENHNGSSDLSIEKFFPTPPEMLEANTNQHGTPDWYNWRVENWGSKWDIHDTLEDEANGKLQDGYDSDWAPVNEFIEMVSVLFPDVEFSIEWQEPGMCFSGQAIYKNGLCIEGGDDKVYQDRFECDEPDEESS